MKFEIKDQFMLDDKPFKILSGAIHYFRIDPSQWYDTLFNLKSMGFNTVETYIPWNLYEPEEGRFNFSGSYDIEKFIKTADKVGLHVLLRPSPFICAEWEFGGLPAWLLNYSNIKLRSSDPLFLEKVEKYYQTLLPHIVPYQVTNGGPVLMMQVENEYGSFGVDKNYLKEIVRMLRKGGVTVPLFTSDGTWIEALSSGTLIDQDILVTGNFGSHSDDNFDALEEFHKQNHKKWPLMCMEYWDGWFNRWGENVVRRDASEMTEDIRKLVKRGSINLYMFCGGTNFGFMNGCSARKNRDLPQVTSYDYDGILTEWGQPTKKYYELKKMLKETFPDIEQSEPILPNVDKYPVVQAKEQAKLFDNIANFPNMHSLYPMSFEQLHHYYGYVVYQSNLKNYYHEENLKVVDGNDRIQIYTDDKFLATQYGEAVSDEVTISGEKEKIKLDVLVENMGRVNYGYKLNAHTQRKGIKGGVMVDHQFQINWDQYLIPFDKTLSQKLNFQSIQNEEITQPIFTKFVVNMKDIKSTFIDCSNYGKGCVVVNGFNIGRYWSKGPIHTLYVPEGLLKNMNEIIVFETENIQVNELKFTDRPIIDEIEE